MQRSCATNFAVQPFLDLVSQGSHDVRYSTDRNYQAGSLFGSGMLHFPGATFWASQIYGI